MISEGKISVNAIAVCKEENLLECVRGSWYIESTTYDDSGIDGLVQRVLDDVTNLSEGECGSVDGTDEKRNGDGGVVAAVVICVVVVVLLMIAIGFYLYKRNEVRGKVEFKKQSTADADVVMETQAVVTEKQEEEEEDDDDENKELSVEK